MTEDEKYYGPARIEAARRNAQRLRTLDEAWEAQKAAPKPVIDEPEDIATGIIYHSVALTMAEWERHKDGLAIGWEVFKIEPTPMPDFVASVYLRKPME